MKSWVSLSLSELSAFYWIRRFITAFTTARHWTLSRAPLIDYTPSHLTYLRHFNIILPSTHRSPKWSLRSATEIVYIFHLYHPYCMSWQFHPHLMTLIISGEACKLWSSLLCSLLQPPSTSSQVIYSPQHHVVRHPQCIFSPSCETPGFTSR